jgi:phosphoribosyl 1,2-cyclic phosphate phosphodiesterase
MDAKLTILGCGGSAGVPAIGNWWGNCDPNEPRNVRTRPSISIMTNNALIIVDAGPDFQAQMNREDLGCPDALIITHAHSDHINGIDEFRTLQRLHKRKFPLYAMADTMKILHHRLDYMFVTSENGFYPAVFDSLPLEAAKPVTIGDLSLIPFTQSHGSIQSLGLRVGNVAYCTDVKKLDDEALKILAGVDVWIVDAAGDKSTTNFVHMGVEEIIELNQTKIGAEKVYLTHLPPSMDYQTLLHELPKGYEPAYDGLQISVRL